MLNQITSFIEKYESKLLGWNEISQEKPGLKPDCSLYKTFFVLR